MELLPLAVFPEGGLSHSVITCVWVGVFVVVFFNLRFGWVLSGLVVPGYLAPLLLVKPVAAAVVVLESMVTFGLVYLFSERASRLGLWPNLFGRDRFFALLLTSVLVRVAFDGYLLPDLAGWLETRYGLAVELRNDLHSFGLIIVCLLANQYWKTGLLRGLFPALVSIGVTWLIIRVVLMPLTNFSISTLDYAYEDIAASILSSPKSYLILLLTALLASRMNLRYGWDFNGILIPSLLALQWYQPEKILASFVEALVICALAVLVLRLPWLRSANIEGGRKLLLFFNLSFAWKLVLGYALVVLAPEVKVTDLYGFGYLLPTLLAIRMHDAGAYVRIVRTTTQTSLSAMLAAGTLAFMLAQLPRPDFATPRLGATTQRAAVIERRPVEDLDHLLQQAKISLYEHRDLQDLDRPFARDLENFDVALQSLLAWRDGGDPQLAQVAADALLRLNYRLLVSDAWMLLLETQHGHGWGTYVLRRAPRSELVLEVPGPLEKRQLVEAAVALYRATGAQALAIAGTGIRLNQNIDALAALEHNAVFQVFHRRLSRGNVLQLRGDAAPMRRLLRVEDEIATAAPRARTANRLWVNRALPEGLDARLLNVAVGDYDVTWRGTPLTNVQREHTGAGFAELVVDTATVRLLQGAPLAVRALQRIDREQRIDGYLQQWLLANKDVLVAARGSEAYVPPGIEQLLYFENQILVPLLEWSDVVATGTASVDDDGVLASLAAAAQAINYRVVHYHELGTEEDFVILAPAGADVQRYWGVYVVRMGVAASHVVQIPRPLYEIGSFEFGITLFDQLDASLVLIAGAHPLANADGSADVVRIDNRRSLFNLVSQSVVRHAAGAPMHLVQVRAFGLRPGLPAPAEDVLVANADANPVTGGQPSPLVTRVLAQLDRVRLSHGWVDGGLDTLGYDASFTLQARYLEQARGVDFTTLWLAPAARRAYRQQSGSRQLLARLEALSLQPREADLYTIVQATPIAAGTRLPRQARELLEGYQRSADMVRLHGFQQRYPHYRLAAVVDANSQQTYLLVHTPAGELICAVNLGDPGSPDEIVLAPGASRAEFRLFIDRRAPWLRFADDSGAVRAAQS